MTLDRYIRIHCFERKSFESYPANTYQSNDLTKITDCIKDILTNRSSGISRIIIEDPLYGESKCYNHINTCAPMEL